jgi:IPT/TIG domain
LPTPGVSGAPVIFFTDITNGPNTGGQNNKGVFVTIYGNFLGTSQGSSQVTLGGVALDNCPIWGATWRWYQKTTCQLGPAVPAGTNNLVLTVNGLHSNAVPFTVQPGNIFFVASTGSDSNNGSFASPWLTIPHAVQTAGASAGNIIYVGVSPTTGVSQTADDGQGWNAALTLRAEWCQGTATEPNALIAYPGASGQIGPSTALSPATGLRGTDYSASPGPCLGRWTFAGLSFRGTAAITTNGGYTLNNNNSSTWRFVGNDISNAQNPGGGGGSAAFELILSINNKILGNYLHDLNQATTDRLAQGLYISTDSNHTEVGWNEIFNSKGRSGLQTHSSNLCAPTCSGDLTGFILYDISIHDNMVHGTAEEAILIDTVDPSQGPIAVYNNVIWDAGRDGNGDNLHMQLSGDFNHQVGPGGTSGPAHIGAGTIDFYNNTIYCQDGAACSGSLFPDIHSGAGYPPTTTVRMRNTILYSANTATPYLDPGFYDGSLCPSTSTPAQCPTWSGSNSLMFGEGAPTFTSLVTGTANSDPLFVNQGLDFHLQSSSPAAGIGVAIPGLIQDIDGRPRPNPPSAGAYEK